MIFVFARWVFPLIYIFHNPMTEKYTTAMCMDTIGKHDQDIMIMSNLINIIIIMIIIKLIIITCGQGQRYKA